MIGLAQVVVGPASSRQVKATPASVSENVKVAVDEFVFAGGKVLMVGFGGVVLS